MCSKAEEKSKVVCKVCGSELELTKKNHYVATDNLKTGALVTLAATEEQWYDAFDCPVCGCQYIAGERKRTVKSRLSISESSITSDEWTEEDSFDVLDEPKEDVDNRQVYREIGMHYTVPSCFGKELKDADSECAGCEHVRNCLNTPSCFGHVLEGSEPCKACDMLIRRACRKIKRELDERNKCMPYPICIGDQALREENNDDCQMCSHIDECTRIIKEVQEQDTEEEKWEESMEMPNEF